MRNISWLSFSRYLFIQRGLDPHNTSSYKSQFMTAKGFYRNKPFTLSMTLKFLEYLAYEKKLSNASINNYIKLLKHIAHYRRAKFMNEISYKPKVRRIPKTLTVAEFKRIVHTHPRRNYRGYCRHVNNIFDCALSLGFLCGMRTGEVCNLTWDDVSGGGIIIRDTKNNEDRNIPLPSPLYNKIQKLPRLSCYVLSQRGEHPMDRNTLNKELKDRLALLGWEGRIDRFHDLRHSFGTLCAETDISLFKIMDYMGHKDISSTELYVHLSRRHLQEVIDRFPANAMNYNSSIHYVHEFVEKMQKASLKVKLQERPSQLTITIEK